MKKFTASKNMNIAVDSRTVMKFIEGNEYCINDNIYKRLSELNVVKVEKKESAEKKIDKKIESRKKK